MCRVYGCGLRVGESTVPGSRGHAESRRNADSPNASSVATAEIRM
jgi:hypothetical protein